MLPKRLGPGAVRAEGRRSRARGSRRIRRFRPGEGFPGAVPIEDRPFGPRFLNPRDGLRRPDAVNQPRLEGPSPANGIDPGSDPAPAREIPARHCRSPANRWCAGTSRAPALWSGQMLRGIRGRGWHSHRQSGTARCRRTVAMPDATDAGTSVRRRLGWLSRRTRHHFTGKPARSQSIPSMNSRLPSRPDRGQCTTCS
jgi:hypothetical protein